MEEKKYIVYCITNKINGKKYIGITSRPLKDRMWQHVNESKKVDGETYNTPFKRAIRKYGIENFEEEILEEGLTSVEASEKERFYIEKFQTYYRYCNSNGYNATIGGELSISHPKDRVVQLDAKTGISINIYGSVTEAESIHGRGISECVNHWNGSLTAGGYCWLYEKEYLEMTDKELFDYVNVLNKRVVQFDKKGNILNIFDGPRDASEVLKLSQGNISMVLLKQRRFTGGYHFMYYDDYLKNGFTIRASNQDRSKKIVQIDDEGNTINTFRSATEAANTIGTKVANISSSIKRNNRCAGYYWKYI